MQKQHARKKRLSVVERVSVAAELVVAAFASLDARAEERLVQRALASRTAGGAFREAVWYFLRARRHEPRLLARFARFPRAVRIRDPSVLGAHIALRSVRVALRALATAAPDVAFDNFACIFARAGGGEPERALLRRRLRELDVSLGAARTRRQREALAEVVAATAGALLTLDPTSVPAATVLVRIHRDRETFGPYLNSVARMRDVLLRHPKRRTRALASVRAEMLLLLAPTADADDFAMAALALAVLDPERTARRCAQLLFSEQYFVRVVVARQLYTLNRGMARLRRYVAQKPADHGVVWVAQRVPRLALKTRLLVVERNLESTNAGDRADAAAMLRDLRGAAARALARRAARDEPEPLVRELLGMAGG